MNAVQAAVGGLVGGVDGPSPIDRGVPNVAALEGALQVTGWTDI